jgi:hypothetical protein
MSGLIEAARAAARRFSFGVRQLGRAPSPRRLRNWLIPPSASRGGGNSLPGGSRLAIVRVPVLVPVPVPSGGRRPHRPAGRYSGEGTSRPPAASVWWSYQIPATLDSTVFGAPIAPIHAWPRRVFMLTAAVGMLFCGSATAFAQCCGSGCGGGGCSPGCGSPGFGSFGFGSPAPNCCCPSGGCGFGCSAGCGCPRAPFGLSLFGGGRCCPPCGSYCGSPCGGGCGSCGGCGPVSGRCCAPPCGAPCGMPCGGGCGGPCGCAPCGGTFCGSPVCGGPVCGPPCGMACGPSYGQSFGPVCGPSCGPSCGPAGCGAGCGSCGASGLGAPAPVWRRLLSDAHLRNQSRAAARRDQSSWISADLAARRSDSRDPRDDHPQTTAATRRQGNSLRAPPGRNLEHGRCDRPDAGRRAVGALGPSAVAAAFPPKRVGRVPHPRAHRRQLAPAR